MHPVISLTLWSTWYRVETSPWIVVPKNARARLLCNIANIVFTVCTCGTVVCAVYICGKEGMYSTYLQYLPTYLPTYLPKYLR